MKKQLTCAVIQDFSGHGRCSATVALPLLSSYGICCSCVPTAVFSNHSGYDSYFFMDLTPQLPGFIAEWKKLGLEFDGIYTGFLGSADQIDIVENFISSFSIGKIIVDPVMGDNGKIFGTYTDSLCRRMSSLAAKADIITPNVTEACILTSTPYPQTAPTQAFLDELAEKLMRIGPKSAVITGIEQNGCISNMVVTKQKTELVTRPVSGKTRPGTGDVFASVVVARVLNGADLVDAVSFAADFVGKSIALADKLGTEQNAGVPFELLLADGEFRL